MFIPGAQEIHLVMVAFGAWFPLQQRGDAKGKKKQHVQKFKMPYSLTKKGFLSEPVNA